MLRLGLAGLARYCRGMTRLRPLLGLLLSLVLAATSLTAAEMRGHAMGSQIIEICSDTADGSQVATIVLDAAGNPMEPPHPCPDCTLGAGLALLTAPPTGLTPPQTLVARLLVVTVSADPATIHAQTPRARAPPLMI